jgi:DNA-binding response OmpR family regulator
MTTIHTIENHTNPKTILIVEDDTMVANYLDLNLKSWGYNMTTIVDNAEDALAIIANQQVDLVLMNIQINGPVNGIEATRIIKAKFDIPVIIITGYSDDETIDSASIAGPDVYLTKPLRRKDLKANINIQLRKYASGTVNNDDSLISICAWCKNIHTDQHNWENIETYITKMYGKQFSHSVCPDCEVILAKQIQPNTQ